MTKIFESDIEKLAIKALENQGYAYLTPEEQETARGNFAAVVLQDRLRDAVTRLNPDIPEDVRKQAIREVLALKGQNLLESNEYFWASPK